jgi:hypothetical protein
MYLWSSNDKIKNILTHIKKNTYDGIGDNINIFNSIANKVIKKVKKVRKVKKTKKDIEVEDRPPDFICEICEKPFKKKGSMNYHITHAVCANKDNQCRFCPARFTTKTSMYAHMRNDCKVRKKEDTNKKPKTKKKKNKIKRILNNI